MKIIIDTEDFYQVDDLIKNISKLHRAILFINRLHDVYYVEFKLVQPHSSEGTPIE